MPDPNGKEGLVAEVQNAPQGVFTKRLLVGGWHLQIPTGAKLTGFVVLAEIRDWPGWCNLVLSANLVKAGTFSEERPGFDEVGRQD